MIRSIGIAMLLGFFAVALGAGIGTAWSEEHRDAALWEAARVSRPSEPIEAPRATLRDLTGRIVDLRDFRGEVVMLYFWATW